MLLLLLLLLRILPVHLHSNNTIARTGVCSYKGWEGDGTVGEGRSGGGTMSNMKCPWSWIWKVGIYILPKYFLDANILPTIQCTYMCTPFTNKHKLCNLHVYIYIYIYSWVLGNYAICTYIYSWVLGYMWAFSRKWIIAKLRVMSGIKSADWQVGESYGQQVKKSNSNIHVYVTFHCTILGTVRIIMQ